ncbi:putative Peptidyl-prolyl cis-trans isomerase 4 [Paratrimastix pyriformis]|uniref:Peptidyl-prolyl cis-trans isomerase 4 n=1 Tax=Paratrimastix pyriformis TaxID=342808 RepID=A0ABQ8UPY4_9EUKA|nr:putative Peptidyl-prolyl cis-trans isomerase 4 [Paratrimastix pyriformis]
MGRSKALNQKSYIKASEWKNDFGGFKGPQQGETFEALPFYCCCLSLQPFREPVCTNSGHIFDKENIYEWIREHHNHPVTGQPLEIRDLFPLHFHKNADGQFQCPATFKVFTPHTHIVAIKTSGHVYSWDAIQQLNIEPQHWKCLMSGTDFTREDIIHIQDPHNLEQRNAQNFQCHRKPIEKEAKPIIAADPTTQRILEALEKKRAEKDSMLSEKQRLDRIIGEQEAQEAAERAIEYVGKGTVEYARGPSMLAASFTSTAMTPHLAVATPKRIREITEKGFVRLETTHGPLNLELRADLVPKTCENFLLLCERGAYDGVIFHRLIKGFMATAWGNEMCASVYVCVSWDGMGVGISRLAPCPALAAHAPVAPPPNRTER